MSNRHDAILLLSFGGPERPDDVIPFLENVLRGKNVPRERMLEVAEHYYHFGGVSPINAQNRALIVALKNELTAHGIDLPVYWGNRNWHPLLADTLREMRDDGVRQAIGLVTSAYSSYSSCRQYLEDIERAQTEVGPDAPRIDKLRPFFNHPGFIEAMTDRVRQALGQLPADRRDRTRIIFSAHSIPLAMATGCQYETQLQEACRLVSERAGHADHVLVYQSRSGPPQQPWLGPDIRDYLRDLHATTDIRHVVLSPIGFVSDHMEVLFDLDTEAMELCQELGITASRAATVGTHPRFVATVRELIQERLGDLPGRSAIGRLEACPDVCPADCCPRGASGRPRD